MKTPAKEKSKRPLLHAFVVAVKQQREVTHVYALLTETIEDALVQIVPLAAEGAQVEPAGMLSKRMARSLKLKHGEPLLV